MGVENYCTNNVDRLNQNPVVWKSSTKSVFANTKKGQISKWFLRKKNTLGHQIQYKMQMEENVGNEGVDKESIYIICYIITWCSINFLPFAVHAHLYAT